MAAGLPGDGAVVLVGLPPGTHHDLGALAFATSLRRAGVGVRYLGADLPTGDWLLGIAQTKARAIVIGAVINRDIKPAAQVARAIREVYPHVLLALGGRVAESVPTEGLEPFIVLPQDLAGSVRALQQWLQLAA
jgi:methanogenic corrinoid protein MtbC1